MTERPTDLPDFDDPPVVEVALAVQFEPLVGMRAVHLGLVWSAYKDQFPLVEEHPPLARVHETFGVPQPTASIALQVMSKPDLPRLWFLDESKTHLVQVQPDRFTRNWRKIKAGETYPRYEGIFKSFIEGFERLQRIAETHSLGAIKPDQCEVTYVNRIESNSGENLSRDMFRVLRQLQEQPPPSDHLEAEGGRLQFRFKMAGEDGGPIGRLTVTVEGGPPTPDDRSVLIVTLTARGRPIEGESNGVAAFLERGRRTIVLSFTSLTTDEMHDRWRRRA